LLLRALVFSYVLTLRTFRLLRPRRKAPPENFDLLLTGTFFSDNWIRAHLTPIARSRKCKRVRFVSVRPLPEIQGVEWIHVPGWLTTCMGEVPSRLITFAVVAITSRPDLIGGFHLLLNAMTSVVLARMLGRRSLYLCVGRARSELLLEAKTENRIFIHLRERDPFIQRWLLEIVSSADLIVPMGSSSMRAHRELGVTSPIEVISGSVDETQYKPSSDVKDFDLVFVGRIAPVKRVDLLLDAVALVKQSMPSIRMLIVGDGPLLDEMKARVSTLGLQKNVEFAGNQAQTAPWLKRARAFMLTSDTEGLSLALMEAMMCGLPAIVSNVGDLGDLIVPAETGYLIDARTPDAFAGAVVELLSDGERLRRYSANALLVAQKYSVPQVANRWDHALSELK
jgi:L-malate glycosyltransferase